MDSALKPRYDQQRRELWLGNRLVKRFREPAKNQELVLLALEEEGWPARIDDPLPGDGKRKPKERLHDTIKKLNQNQVNKVLHFSGDGTGRAICWETISQSKGPSKRRYHQRVST